MESVVYYTGLVIGLALPLFIMLLVLRRVALASPRAEARRDLAADLGVNLRPDAECNHPCHRCSHNSLVLCPVDNQQFACGECIATDAEIKALVHAYNAKHCHVLE